MAGAITVRARRALVSYRRLTVVSADAENEGAQLSIAQNIAVHLRVDAAFLLWKAQENNFSHRG